MPRPEHRVTEPTPSPRKLHSQLSDAGHPRVSDFHRNHLCLWRLTWETVLRR